MPRPQSATRLDRGTGADLASASRSRMATIRAHRQSEPFRCRGPHGGLAEPADLPFEARTAGVDDAPGPTMSASPKDLNRDAVQT